MTITEAITKFDEVYKNNIPYKLKLEWISNLDSTVYNEIIRSHENSESVVFSPYNLTTSGDTLLIVPEPYSEIYLHFLAMKKDLYLYDISRYNNDLALFTTAYIEFENYYNSQNMPVKNVNYFNV